MFQLLGHLCFQYLPESARYLVAAGKKHDAMKILQKAAKMNRSTLPQGTVVDSHVVSTYIYYI